MNTRSAAETYRRQSIENAPPVKVVQLLYAGALRFLDQALASDPKAPGAPRSAGTPFAENLARADEIVIELRLALDEPTAPELVASLKPLAFYVEERIAEALAKREHAPARIARDVLAKLQQGWASIEIDPQGGEPAR
jgi:flagellar protein FliS